jgi:AcrR family transcriptional regulator
MTATGPRHLRADAARNRRRLIQAAAEVFAARGLDATLDDIARHADVNIATAYRHFANKHQLARSFLEDTPDQAAAIAGQAAATEDPWAGLTWFLEQITGLITSNRGLLDQLTRAYGPDWFEQRMHAILAGPVQQMITRGQQAGLVRPDMDAADFALIVPMVGSIASRTTPDLGRRYLSLVLAGLRPGGPPLPGAPPTDAQLRATLRDRPGSSRAPRPKPRLPHERRPHTPPGGSEVSRAG